MKFLDVEVRTASVFHAYDSNNQPVSETLSEDRFVRKLLAIDRIRSISDDYLLVNGADGREMYWEYKGSIDELKVKLQNMEVAVV